MRQEHEGRDYWEYYQEICDIHIVSLKRTSPQSLKVLTVKLTKWLVVSLVSVRSNKRGRDEPSSTSA